MFSSTPSQAFFRFRIPEHGVSELFLFAGGVVEPDITVDRTRVDYGALMLGAALKETFHIVNRESMPHSFVFDKNSLGMAQVRHETQWNTSKIFFRRSIFSTGDVKRFLYCTHSMAPLFFYLVVTAVVILAEQVMPHCAVFLFYKICMWGPVQHENYTSAGSIGLQPCLGCCCNSPA